MKPKLLLHNYFAILAAIPFAVSILFFSSHLDIIIFHLSAAVSFALLIILVRNLRAQYSSKEFITFLLLLITPILTLITYDLSFIHKKHIYNNWEEITKTTLLEETRDLQNRFLKLQQKISLEAQNLTTIIEKSSLTKTINGRGETQKEALALLSSDKNIGDPGEQSEGFGLFDMQGELIGWNGSNPPDHPPSMSVHEGRDSYFTISSDEVHSFLNSVSIIKNEDGKKYLLVIRRLVRSNFRIKNRFFTDYDFFAGSSGYNRDISFIDAEDVEARVQWEKLFYMNKDLYWGRSGEATRTIIVPLRNLSFEILGYASITTPTLGEKLHKVSSSYYFVCETITLIVFLLFVIRSLARYLKKDKSIYNSSRLSFLKRYETPASLILVLWGFRLTFLLFGYPVRFSELNIFQPVSFAMDIFHFSNLFLDELFNLYVSPFDLFFTIIISLISALVFFHVFIIKISGKITGTGRSTKELRVINVSTKNRIFVLASGLIIAIMLTSGLSTISNLFIGAAFENSRIDILGSALVDYSISSLFIQLSFLLFSITHILIMTAICYFTFLILINSRSLKSTERTIYAIFVIIILILISFGMPPLWITATIILSLVIFSVSLRKIGDRKARPVFYRLAIYFFIPLFSIVSFSPLYFHIFERQQESFIERNLVNRIEEQKAWKTILIENALRKHTRDRALIAKLKNRNRENLGALAYSLWSKLDTSLKGYNTSLEILDKKGNLIDRFSINPLFNQHDLTPGEIIEVIHLSSKWIVYNNRNVEIIVGTASIRDGSADVAQILLSYALDYDYILLPTSRNPYYELFRMSESEFADTSVFDNNLFLAIFDEEGNFKYGSDEFVLPLDNPVFTDIGAFRKPGWVTINGEEGEYKTYIFKQGDDTYVLGFPRLTTLNKLFYYSELVGICFAMALLYLFTISLFRISSFIKKAKDREKFSEFIRSSYVRLLVMFIILSFIPVFYLSNFSRNHLNNKLSEEVQKRGVNSLKVVKRYLDFNILRAVIRDFDTIVNSITEPLISDIGRWVNRDLNIYFGRELLATNKQELFYSRLLPTMISNRIYRDLLYSKKLYTTTEGKIGDLSFLIVSTAIQTETQDHPLIISIPLMTEQNRIREELVSFDRLILLVVVTLALIFVFASHNLARYFARPIQILTQSAEEIAGGNYHVQVDINRKDEIGSLIKSFNRMSRNLETQRKELYKKTKDLESILQNASSKIISFDPRGSILTINPASLTFLRLKEEQKDYIGQNIRELLGSNNSYKYLLEAFNGYSEKPDAPIHTDLRMVFTDEEKNKEVVANLFITPMIDEKGKLYASLMIIEDATEIIRSQRLEAWAEMARIIAHEIKNPLTPIQLAAEHLQEVIRDRPDNLDDISNECLSTILGQVIVLQQISNDFSRYSRLPQLRAEPVDLGIFIKKVVSPYSVAPPENVKITVKMPTKPPKVLIDKKLIEQTLINLFENSFQAMQNGGELTIHVDYSKKLKEHGMVGIYVKDTGAGISPKILPRIFEPYFTTKDRGVGLGLAIAKKTIEEHQGSIEIVSEVDKGTSIKIYLKVYTGQSSS